MESSFGKDAMFSSDVLSEELCKFLFCGDQQLAQGIQLNGKHA